MQGTYNNTTGLREYLANRCSKAHNYHYYCIDIYVVFFLSLYVRKENVVIMRSHENSVRHHHNHMFFFEDKPILNAIIEAEYEKMQCIINVTRWLLLLCATIEHKDVIICMHRITRIRTT